MYISSILSLPSTVVLLLCATSLSADSPWPHNLPKHMKYFPEDEVHVKRALDIAERLRHEKPVGIKKMSLDEGEMFMLDNWIFAQSPTKRSALEPSGNGTCQARAPLRPHNVDDSYLRFQARNALLKRQFQCPEGTASCSSIGAPDVCCGTGLTCINVEGDSDAGSVGCCPQGQTCAGSVSCDTDNGYSACPDASNGGCCMPGFQCSGIGCVAVGTSVVYILPSTATPSSTPTSSAAPVLSTEAPATSSSSSSFSSSSSTSSTSAYTCSTGWFSCAASLGGGCCQNGRTCATGASCLGSSTSTQAPSAPVRPTSLSVTTTSIIASALPGNDVCPSGFYVCSAYLPSGCCRVGRDCQTTGSCGLPSGTVLDSNGVVIVAPTGATVASSTGSCPSSWFNCPADQGGNCCPEGYACGEQCTATASGQSGVTGKVTASGSQASFVSGWSVGVGVSAAFAVGVAMVVL